MSDRLHVGTRKGLFHYTRGADSWQLAGPPAFLAGPVTAFMVDPRDGAQYVALQHGHFGCKFHRSQDNGKSWQEFPTPAYPASDAPDAPALDMIWVLSPGGADQPGLIWAGTLPGGLFKSANRGESWELVESLWARPERAKWFGGGYDHPGIHSIITDARDSQHITLGVSCGGCWHSFDCGQSWAQAGHGFNAAFLPPEQASDPTSQDPHFIAACTNAPDRVWCQHHCGVYRSDDGGMNFTELHNVPPSNFGFAVAAHPHEPDTAWFAPAVKDECRVPVDGKFVITRTRDGGQSFEVLDNGLPSAPSYDLVYRHALIVDETGNRLATGSTTGNLWLSENMGDSWQQLSSTLPPIATLAFS